MVPQPVECRIGYRLLVVPDENLISSITKCLKCRVIIVGIQLLAKLRFGGRINSSRKQTKLQPSDLSFANMGQTAFSFSRVSIQPKRSVKCFCILGFQGSVNVVSSGFMNRREVLSTWYPRQRSFCILGCRVMLIVFRKILEAMTKNTEIGWCGFGRKRPHGLRPSS